MSSAAPSKRRSARNVLIALPVAALVAGCAEAPDVYEDTSVGDNCEHDEVGWYWDATAAGLCAWLQVDPDTGRVRAYAEERSEDKGHSKYSKNWSRSDDPIPLRIDRIELRRDGEVISGPVSQSDFETTATRTEATDWVPCPTSGTLTTVVFATFRDDDGGEYPLESESDSVDAVEVCALGSAAARESRSAEPTFGR